MLKNLLTYAQYLLPQHALSKLMGLLAESENVGLKNFLIQHFINRYQVDMKTALFEDPASYSSFNNFFIRELKPALRPIATADEIASPVDGIVSEIGLINKNLLLQAKNFYFDLKTLLGNDEELAKDFLDGSFATFYLAPKDYHRVHMPLSGKLEKTIYIPGKLFSVNRLTSQLIPNLYSRNERLVSVFETKAQRMVVILIAAIIVGKIKISWIPKPIEAKQLETLAYADSNIVLSKGAELGYFKMGSTVLVLFKKNAVKWSPTITPGYQVRYGESLGTSI